MNSPLTKSLRKSALPIAVGAAVLTFLLAWLGLFAPLNRLFFDSLISLNNEPPPEDIVIVAIDQKSIDGMGRFSRWSRNDHARLLDKLTEYQARVVAYDVFFDEGDPNDLDDSALISAVKNNGKVVMPVIIGERNNRGQLLESLPFIEVAQYSAALGHGHVPLDSDNIARSVFLFEGLGEPHWPAFALAVEGVVRGEIRADLPGERNPKLVSGADAGGSTTLSVISKDYQNLIPFQGPPGHFYEVSFIDVLQDPSVAETIRGKVVFVGATAAGLGDYLPTPFASSTQKMPGVEVHANIYHGLTNDLLIQPQPKWLSSLLIALLAGLFTFLLPKIAPRQTLAMLIAFALVAISLSWALLHFAHQWLPLIAAVLATSAIYVVWVWRKIVLNMIFFNNTLQSLNRETQGSINLERSRFNDALSFWQQIGLVNSWTYREEGDQDVADKKLPLLGKPISSDLDPLGTRNPYVLPGSLARHQLAIDVEPSRQISAGEERFLRRAIRVLATPSKGDVVESEAGVIETRISSLERAIHKLTFLREFIQNTLDRMPQGVIVADYTGALLFANKMAVLAFPVMQKGDVGHNLFELMEQLNISGQETTASVLREAFTGSDSVSLQAVTANSRYLKMVISRLSNVEGRDYFVATFSDITDVKLEQRRQLEMLDFLSHDFRSPLTSVLSAIRAQKGREHWDPKFLPELEALTEKSIDMAEQFLQLTRAESAAEIKFYDVEINSVIDDAIDVVRSHAADRDISIDYDFDANDDIWLQANPKLLERMLVNLLSNAIKYSKPSTRVSISIVQQPDWLLLKVADQGEGIPADQIEKIFQPYARLERDKAR